MSYRGSAPGYVLAITFRSISALPVSVALTAAALGLIPGLRRIWVKSAVQQVRQSLPVCPDEPAFQGAARTSRWAINGSRSSPIPINLSAWGGATRGCGAFCARSQPRGWGVLVGTALLRIISRDPVKASRFHTAGVNLPSERAAINSDVARRMNSVAVGTSHLCQQAAEFLAETGCRDDRTGL